MTKVFHYLGICNFYKAGIKKLSTVEHHELEHQSVVFENWFFFVQLERTLVEILKISVPSDAENRVVHNVDEDLRFS